MGSACQVWEGVETETGDRYALKVLREDFRKDRLEISYLKSEYEIAKAMDHSNVIKMYNLVLSGPSPYLVLELFSELNMKQAMRRGPDCIAYMLETVLQQITEGLSYMHTEGYVHCDIKPDNFLVSREGEVKVIDFTISQKIKKGLAKMLSGRTRKIRGTRSYMSPEQIRGQHLDGRSDIYSLGCVFYESVAGKPPFTGESPNLLLNKHISAPIPSLLVANDNVTPEFTSVVKTMMAKSPGDRQDSMWDLLKVLKVTKIYRKQPRIPEKSIFDDFPSAGRIVNQDEDQD